MGLDEILYRWLDVWKYESVLILYDEENKIETSDSRIVFINLNQLEDFAAENMQKKYELILAIYAIEQSDAPVKLLKRLESMLDEHGVLYVGTYNRLALSFFCGETDPFTGNCFSGLENYNESGFSVRAKRCYAQNELEAILDSAGLIDRKMYAVYPNILLPQHIFSDTYVPKEDMTNRYTPLYSNSDTVLLKEENILDALAKNHMLLTMANNYLIEYRKSGNISEMQYVSVSYNRGKDKAMALTIYENGIVEKRALYEEGVGNLKVLYDNIQDIKKRGLMVVDGRMENGRYVMPYINAPTGNLYLQELASRDKDKFIQKMDEFCELILQSSEIVEKNQYGSILKKGYLDLVPLNSFVIDDKFYFYDQEFCYENIPANVIIFRSIVIVYHGLRDIERVLPRRFFMERYHVQENLNYYEKLASNFITDLCNRKKLAVFNSVHTRNEWVTGYNKKMLAEKDFYNKYKKECFKEMQGKRVIIFGAGRFARKFIAFYKYDYQIDKIIDNDKSKWGKTIEGIPITSPDSLMDENTDYKVIICTKYYESIFKQLKAMRITDIGIYDVNMIYPGRQEYFPNAKIIEMTDNEKKAYHIGYLSGVFDLFHIGHVNILKKAKAQCDYLIVAVTSDEYVRTKKKREPYIPFDERVEILRSCRYADEVVGVPFEFAGTVDAFRKYHFDVQFCGSDYENDKWWLQQKVWLEEHDATLQFFPYTEQTSSTKIKALIEKNLL